MLFRIILICLIEHFYNLKTKQRECFINDQHFYCTGVSKSVYSSTGIIEEVNSGREFADDDEGEGEDEEAGNSKSQQDKVSPPLGGINVSSFWRKVANLQPLPIVPS